MSEKIFNKDHAVIIPLPGGQRTDSSESSESEDTMKFCTSNHASDTMLNFNQMRQNNVLVDVVLVVGGKEFPAHRALLASCSEYFRAMFTSNTVEAQQRNIELRNLRPNGVSAVLDYMYTSEIELNIQNVQDVMSAASYVQMDQITEMCVKFLRKNVTDENFVDLLHLAKLYSHWLLMKFVLLYIGNNLLRLSKTSEFQRLTEMQIREVLSGEFPVVFDELEVLGVLLRWYRTRCADAEEETENLLALINNSIRFNLFTLAELKNYCDGDEFRGLMIGEQNLCDHLLATNGGVHTLRESSPTAEEKLINYRGLDRAFVMVGGFYNCDITNDVTFCFCEDFLPNANIELHKRVYGWHWLTKVPHVKQCNFGCAVLNNKLYVVGGCYNTMLVEYKHGFGYCYCPITDDWTKIADMAHERCRHTLNAIADKYLVAVGGNTDPQDPDMVISSCEAYDLTRNEWHPLEALPEYKSQHASAVIGNLLYVSGGIDRDQVPSATFWCFDWTTRRWQPLPPMQDARADHAMVVIEGKLYVCGGWYDNNGVRTLVPTIDRYENNGWREVTRVQNPVLHSGVHVDGSRLIIVGGYTETNILNRFPSTVPYFDVATNTWGNKNFTSDTWEYSSEALYVPRYLGPESRNFDLFYEIENM